MLASMLCHATMFVTPTEFHNLLAAVQQRSWARMDRPAVLLLVREVLSGEAPATPPQPSAPTPSTLRKGSSFREQARARPPLHGHAAPRPAPSDAPSARPIATPRPHRHPAAPSPPRGPIAPRGHAPLPHAPPPCPSPHRAPEPTPVPGAQHREGPERPTESAERRAERRGGNAHARAGSVGACVAQPAGVAHAGAHGPTIGGGDRTRGGARAGQAAAAAAILLGGQPQLAKLQGAATARPAARALQAPCTLCARSMHALCTLAACARRHTRRTAAARAPHSALREHRASAVVRPHAHSPPRHTPHLRRTASRHTCAAPR